jgi:NMD protein affecting ribosome stability and mRNA decay
MNKPRYPQFKIGDLVQLKKRYAQVDSYGIIIQVGSEENWDLDERFVSVWWAKPDNSGIYNERIRTLNLVKAA